MIQDPDAGQGALSPAGSPATPRALAIALPLVFWAVGMLACHWPMLASGFDRVQGDQLDSWLLHYMLEHDVRWMARDPVHSRLWDPPIFHPAPNAAAYSETLLGVVPLYAVWRLLGVSWDLAYALWLLSVSSLNFLASYLLLHRTLRRGVVAAAFGAFLFSFASSRFSHLGQSQLLAGFYLCLAAHAAIRIFESNDRSPRWVAVLAVAVVAQVYACFYVGWFLILTLGLALAWALALPDLRGPTIAVLRRNALGILAAGAAGGAALLPFLIHSMRAATESGLRPFDEVEMFLPRPQSWVYMGAGNWLYGWQAGRAPFDRLPGGPVEHAIGIGLVAPVLAAVGLWDSRRTPLGKLLLLLTATLVVVASLFPFGATLWAAVYMVVPGAGAIRAVGRVAFLLLLPASVGLASFLESRCRRMPMLFGLAALALVEQGRSTASFERGEARDRRQALVRRLDPGCSAFLYTVRASGLPPGFLDGFSWRYHCDAMMASLDAGVPTINGYSGGAPHGWPFQHEAVVSDAEAEKKVERLLRDWCRRGGIDPDRVCWIRERAIR